MFPKNGYIGGQVGVLAGHDEGAAAGGRIASLIKTAKLNCIELYARLKTALGAIAAVDLNNRSMTCYPGSSSLRQAETRVPRSHRLRKIDLV